MLGLIGHLLGTALIFVVFLVIVWTISFLLFSLDSYQKFPAEIYTIISKIEVGLIYADALLSGVVLLAGMWRFCLDLMKAPRI